MKKYYHWRTSPEALHPNRSGKTTRSSTKSICPPAYVYSNRDPLGMWGFCFPEIHGKVMQGIAASSCRRGRALFLIRRARDKFLIGKIREGVSFEDDEFMTRGVRKEIRIMSIFCLLLTISRAWVKWRGFVLLTYFFPDDDLFIKSPWIYEE